MIRSIKYDEVIGETKKRIFNIIGLSAESTDYAQRHTYTTDEYVLSDSVLVKNQTGDYYELDNILREQRATIITTGGKEDTRKIHNPLMGIRLSGNFSDIKDQATLVEDLGDGIKIVEFGEYPTTSVYEIQGLKTYQLDKETVLLETGKTYWVPSLGVQLYLSPLLEPHVKYYWGDDIPEEYVEIKEYVDCFGNKYVGFDNSYYLVEPVRWYVDEKEDYIVSVNTIAGGVPYGSYFSMLNPEEKDTYSVDYFVENMLVQNLIPSEIYELPKEYIPEPITEEQSSVEETKPLPNLDGLNRNQLVVLQHEIAKLLSQKNKQSSYVPKLTLK